MPNECTKVFDSLTIPDSGADAKSIADLLGLTQAELNEVTGVEIAAHSAAFQYGRTKALTAKRTQAAYEPYYRSCGGSQLAVTFIRAVGAGAISSVEIEVEFKSQLT